MLLGMIATMAVLVAVLLRMRRTLTETEGLMAELREDIDRLTPRLDSALRVIERSGTEIGRTADSATNILDRVGGRSGSSGLVDTASRLLPLLVPLAGSLGSLFRRKKKKREDRE